MYPDNDTLVGALKALRVHYPSLGRSKVIEKFRRDRDWQISDKRMKVIMEGTQSGTCSCTIAPEASVDVNALLGTLSRQ